MLAGFEHFFQKVEMQKTYMLTQADRYTRETYTVYHSAYLFHLNTKKHSREEKRRKEINQGQ